MPFDPKKITREHILQAVKKIEDEDIPLIASTRWLVNIEGKEYPPKEIMRYAHEQMNGEKIWQPGGGEATNIYLKNLGFKMTDLKEEPYFQLSKFQLYSKEALLKYNKNSDSADFYKDTRSKLQYLGQRLGADLDIKLVNNYNERPDKMAGRGKGLVLKPYILAGFIPTKYHVGKNIFIKLTFYVQDQKVYFLTEVDINFSDVNNPYKLQRNKIQEQTNWTIPVDENFPKNWDDLATMVKPAFAKNLAFINNFFNQNKKEVELSKLIDVLKYKKQIILQGPPGTGKTYSAKDFAEQLIYNSITPDKKEQKKKLEASSQFSLVQFHPSYTYEDFLRGISVISEDGKILYKTENKKFGEIISQANQNKSNDYVLIIDEINRANLPSVLGELIYGLEYRGEAVESMYAIDGENKITIPKNLYIIGTMNTADRSVGHIDYAIRRRFAFVDVLPKVLDDTEEFKFQKEVFEKVSKLFVEEIKERAIDLVASEHLSAEFSDRPQDVWLGHSYFIDDEKVDFRIRLEFEIIPILKEYVKDGILKNTEEVNDIIKSLLS